MSISYTKEQKQKAKADGLHLVSIDVGWAMSFQGAVSEEERDELAKYLIAFLGRRRATLKAVAAEIDSVIREVAP